MDNLNEDHFSGFAIDHLGLVADKIDSLGIIPFIDEKLPLTAGCGSKTTMGERVAAMILNGLGFIDTRLYLFPEFLVKKPVARLFGKPLQAQWFNDDALGRCLDAIATYGTTKLFTELSFSIGIKRNLLGRSAHFDTSTLQLSGDYFNAESQEEGPVPARGYSKTKRHDLKQMVINLATTGKANFPIWMESHSGNASDQTILPGAAERMNVFCQKLSDVPDFIYVGDSAMYANILAYSQDMKWLSRVPETLSEAKALLSISSEKLTWTALGEGYAYCPHESTYGDVNQRWVMIFSEQAYNREIKTLERNISKEWIELEKEYKKISHEVFSCPVDAKNTIEKMSKKMKYHQISYEIEPITGHDRKGRPNKEAPPKIKGYQMTFSLKSDTVKIEAATIKKGRFILSTNELDRARLPDADILKEYKAQSGTERGFKFIKDDAFSVDSIFLKTPKRIDSLMMIMTLCLMVYGVGQHDLRTALKEKN